MTDAQEQLQRILPLFPFAIRKKIPREVRGVMISERISRGLNRRYRRKNGPTNILSFRYDATYGELLLCGAVIWREAREQKISVQKRMTQLLIHGMLHLAGIHHERSAAAAVRMECIENEILQKMQNSEHKTRSRGARIKAFIG